MKRISLIFFCSIFILLLCIPLRAWNIYIAYPIESICYFTFTYFILKRYATNKADLARIASTILLSRILVDIYPRAVNWEDSLVSLIGTLFTIVSIVLAALHYYIKRPYVLLFFGLTWLYFTFIGHGRWREYVIYGNTPSNLNLSSFSFETIGDSIQIKDLNEDYTILDFWSSSCRVCLSKFPVIQNFHNRHQNDKKTSIYSVFVKNKNESIYDGVKIRDGKNFSFPIWSISGNDSLHRYLNIDGYPLVIVLDKNKNVIYRGSIETAIKKLH